MIMAARSPASKSASSSARVRGRAISLKSEYVSRTFSRSRSASIRHTWVAKRSSASRRAAPRHVYCRRSSINRLFHHRGANLRIKPCLSVHYLHKRKAGRKWPGCLNHSPRFSRGSLRILFLQSRLNLPRKSPEVCDALQFIVRQLDMKMMLQPGEQFESLQAVNAERLEKVFVRIQFLPRHFEMGGRQVKNFVERLLGSGHRVRFHFIWHSLRLRQIRLRLGAFGKLFQPSRYRRARKQFAEDVNFPPQLFMRDRFDKPFRSRCSLAIEFSQLSRRRPSSSQRLSFPNHLTHQPNLLRFGRIEAAAGEQQISHHGIAQIPFQPRDSPETRDQSQP